MMLEISNGELRLPKSNLNIVFKDDKKAMSDMDRLGKEFNENPDNKELYQVFIELLELNKDNIEETFFSNINDHEHDEDSDDDYDYDEDED